MTRKINILYIVDKIRNVGGIEKIVIDKANYLSEQDNYRISILALDFEEDSNCFFTLNLKTKVYTNPKSKNNYGFKYFIFTFKRIKHVVKTEKPDYIILTRPFLIENAICGFFSPTTKRIIELHSSFEVFNFGDFFFKQVKKVQDISFKKISSKIFPFCFKIVTLCKRDITLWGYSNILFIPNFSTIKPNKTSTCTTKTAISVGRYVYPKGYELLIESWSAVYMKHPDWTLEIWGDGIEKENLQNLINLLGLNLAITLNGYNNKMEDVYTHASIYVMSSRFEGFPLVLIEAQKCGLPIVLFDLPCGPNEIINNQIDGIICKYMNINDLSENILLLIENEELRIRMGKMAQQNAQRFTEEIIMKQWMDLFEQGIKYHINLIEVLKIWLNSTYVIFVYFKSYIKKFILDLKK